MFYVAGLQLIYDEILKTVGKKVSPTEEYLKHRMLFHAFSQTVGKRVFSFIDTF
jgi:hypothetical protein